jgi:hypothetical protein
MNQQTAATKRVGTVAYMAPELMMGGKYNEVTVLNFILT